MADTTPFLTLETREALRQKAERALDSIRPYLETDGGNVKVAEVTEDSVVRLEMLGNCGNCPMSSMTLKAGLEQTLLNALPEIKGVEAVNLTAPDDPNAKLPT